MMPVTVITLGRSSPRRTPAAVRNSAWQRHERRASAALENAAELPGCLQSNPLPRAAVQQGHSCEVSAPRVRGWTVAAGQIFFSETSTVEVRS